MYVAWQYLFNASNSPDKFLFYHIGHDYSVPFLILHSWGIKENSYIGRNGHTVVDINGPVCECGKKGCLQTYISESWLIKTRSSFCLTALPITFTKVLLPLRNDITIETIIKAIIGIRVILISPTKIDVKG